MGECKVCRKAAATISGSLGVCLECIRNKPEAALEVTKDAHVASRMIYDLPGEPPRDDCGLQCHTCANRCKIGRDKLGFCGLVKNVGERLFRFGGTADRGVLEWYYDRLPTNCVSASFCPGCTGEGYPEFAYRPEAEYGFSNLAVFYGACSYDCLYCQNSSFRTLSAKHTPVMSATALAEKVHSSVSCICFFGGDPSPQMPHSLEVSRMAQEKAAEDDRILRVCWETNGNINPKLAVEAGKHALRTGGNMKFDLKSWSEDLNEALCGISNATAKLNFCKIGEELHGQRPDLPVLSASTLLVPGYIDTEEVRSIAGFIERIDPDINYTLLAFKPSYIMDDLPATSRKQALECKKTAEKHLRNTRIGNMHLLV